MQPPSEAPEPTPGHVAGDSATVAVWTTVSRVTGVVKIAAIAAVLGPTFMGNLFQALNLLPNLAYEFLTGTLFVRLLVPALMRHAGENQRFDLLASRFLALSLAGFVTLTLIVIAAGPLLLAVFAAGVTDPVIAAAQRQAGWLLLVLLTPQVVGYGITGTAGAVLNARGRFGLPAGAPAVENVGIVITLVVVAWRFGTGVEVDAVSTGQLLLLGLGTTGAVALHAALLWVAAVQEGVSLRPRLGWRDPDVVAVLRRLVPSFGFAGLNSLRTFAMLVVANHIPGGVVAFQLAYNFHNLPVALSAKAVGTALLPRLAVLHHRERFSAFRDELVRGMGLTTFIAVPSAVGLVALAEPLARAVAYGEMASPRGIQLTAVALAAIAGGIAGEAWFELTMSASYAQDDAVSPLRSTMARTVFTLALLGAGILFTDGVVLMAVIGMAVTLPNLTSAGHLWKRVSSRLPQGQDGPGPAIARGLGGAAVMVGPAYLAATGTARLLPGAVGDLAAAVAAAAVGFAVYVAVLRAWKAPELAGWGEAFARGSRGPRRPRSDADV